VPQTMKMHKMRPVSGYRLSWVEIVVTGRPVLQIQDRGNVPPAFQYTQESLSFGALGRPILITQVLSKHGQTS
jgi:hypothetical protein